MFVGIRIDEYTCSKLKLEWAKLCGKRFEVEDDGYKLVGYFLNGKTYITEMTPPQPVVLPIEGQ